MMVDRYQTIIRLRHLTFLNSTCLSCNGDGSARGHLFVKLLQFLCSCIPEHFAVLSCCHFTAGCKFGKKLFSEINESNNNVAFIVKTLFCLNLNQTPDMYKYKIRSGQGHISTFLAKKCLPEYSYSL